MVTAGPWVPDLAGNEHEGLTKASGVYGIANGYRPWRQLDAVTTALSGWSGGGAFIGSDGTSALLSGSNTGLFRWTGAAWVSLIAVAAGKWQFAQFGDFAIGVHGGAPVKYDVVGGAAASLGGSPPNAKYITVSGNFVVLAGDEAAVTTVSWSGFNAAETWTPGTNQSDSDIIPDGGRITGLVGHENYFLVFQRDAIHRYTYVGVPGIFQRDKISTGVGCIAPGSIAQAGGTTFFLSERGFMTTDGNSVSPIGDGKVDQTFLDTYPRAELGNLTATVDPRKYLYVLAMNGRLWLYAWSVDKWTDAVAGVQAVFPAFTSNISLDALDALYPGGLDTIPVSLDSPVFQGGEPRLYGVQAGVVGAFSGANMAAEFEWPYKDYGQRIRPFMARPITDAIEGMTLAIDAKARLGDGEAKRSESELRASGNMPIRCNGKHLKPSVSIAAGTTWSYFQGLQLEYGAGGRR